MNEKNNYLKKEIDWSYLVVKNLSKRIDDCYELIGKVAQSPVVGTDDDSIPKIILTTTIKDIVGAIAMGFFCGAAYVLEKGGATYSILLGSMFTAKVGYDIYNIHQEKKRRIDLEKSDDIVDTDYLLNEIKRCKDKILEHRLHILACKKELDFSNLLTDSYLQENSMLEPWKEDFEQFQNEKINTEAIHFDNSIDTNRDMENSKQLLKSLPKYR